MEKSTPAQVALSWLLAQKPRIAPVPGITRLNRLVENIGSVDVVFADDELNEIENASSQIKLQGDRYPEHLQKLVNR